MQCEYNDVVNKPKWLHNSTRLHFRHLVASDVAPLRQILGDKETMYAWEHAFTDLQITQFIERSNLSHHNNGYGYCAAIDKLSGEMIGLIGLLDEKIENPTYIGLGYIVAKKHWDKGYATEGAWSWREYAATILQAKMLIADIKEGNIASIHVAKKLGMQYIGNHNKYYNGKYMPHEIYALNL